MSFVMVGGQSFSSTISVMAAPYNMCFVTFRDVYSDVGTDRFPSMCASYPIPRWSVPVYLHVVVFTCFLVMSHVAPSALAFSDAGSFSILLAH